MSHLGVFPIKPRGPQWRGCSCPKNERCSIQDLDVECGLEHTFTSNHALTSSFYAREKGLLFDFWLWEKNGVAGVENDIFIMKSNDVPFWERISLGNSVKHIAILLSVTLVFACLPSPIEDGGDIVPWYLGLMDFHYLIHFGFL